jgi:hypothetical protein
MNPTRPYVEVTIKNTALKLTFDIDSIAEAEELTKQALITGIRAEDVTAPRINLVRALFYACAKANDPSFTFNDAKKLVTLKNLSEIWLAVLNAWKDCSSDEVTEETGEAQDQK